MVSGKYNRKELVLIEWQFAECRYNNHFMSVTYFYACSIYTTCLETIYNSRILEETVKDNNDVNMMDSQK
jgi:hypothetical protein